MRYIRIASILLCFVIVLLLPAQGACEIGCKCGNPSCNCGETGQCVSSLSSTGGPQLPVKEILEVLAIFLIYKYIIKPIFSGGKTKEVATYSSNNEMETIRSAVPGGTSVAIQFLPKTDLGNQTVEIGRPIITDIRRKS